MGRYQRNIGTITSEEQTLLKEKTVCIIGCGGLGGGVIENLVRFGVGHLTAVDGDVFDESNLNRQVLSNEKNLGRPKAIEAAAQMQQINSDVQITPVQDLLTEANVNDIINGHDVVVDALDNIDTRLILEQACNRAGIPLVHGAIGGWSGQVGVVMPGSNILERLYEDSFVAETANANYVDKPTNPSFTPAVIAAMEAAETVKVLLGKEEFLKNRLLMIDLLYHEYEIIDFD